MFSESAEIYDLIYAGFKNYAEESAKLAAPLRHLHPTCRFVLDVACGTGEHARFLTNDHGFRVDGLDLQEFPYSDNCLFPTGLKRVRDSSESCASS